MPAISPWVATADSFHRQKAACQRAVMPDGLGGVLRAGGRKAAAAGTSKQEDLRRRKEQAVKADEK